MGIGCMPAQFQIAFPIPKTSGSARKGICQVLPGFLFFIFYKLTIFFEHLNLLRCCHSKMHLRWFKFGKHLENRVSETDLLENLNKKQS